MAIKVDPMYFLNVCFRNYQKKQHESETRVTLQADLFGVIGHFT